MIGERFKPRSQAFDRESGIWFTAMLRQGFRSDIPIVMWTTEPVEDLVVTTGVSVFFNQLAGSATMRALTETALQLAESYRAGLEAGTAAPKRALGSSIDVELPMPPSIRELLEATEERRHLGQS
ncbi:hypothetical protein [Stratiformator vulcanicus]|uniref:Uncharacterized protein n=1 Tax=Stratiformator vulcanicus TaxID=2527980 RepID=A0A517R3D7_9PLAN|nr:hypothetical protein [Stratiformator vulcanicus]QDT38408.1 hypothetical protein Pan189_28010 [Stratiformator vulcanicus]